MPPHTSHTACDLEGPCAGRPSPPHLHHPYESHAAAAVAVAAAAAELLAEGEREDKQVQMRPKQ